MGEQFFLYAAAGLAGGAVGFFVPPLCDRLAGYKLRKKGRELEADPRFTGAAARTLCLLANGTGWALCAIRGEGAAACLAGLIWSLGLAMMVIDLRLRILPNELLAAALAAGAALQVLTGGLSGLSHGVFASLLIFAGLMALGNFMGLYKIGAGDVKLAVVMAMTLGYPMVAAGMGAMAVSMLVFCGAGLLLKKITLKSMIPFGPFLVPGLWVGLFLIL